MGIRRSLARSRATRAQAAIRVPARTRQELLRCVCRLHRTPEGLRGRELDRGVARLRLAVDDQACVARRTDVDRLAASEGQDIDAAVSRATEEIQGVSR